MATEMEGGNLESVEAASDLSSNSEFRFGELQADGQIDVCGTQGNTCYGVIKGNPDAAGKAVPVQTSGLTKVEAGESINEGDEIISNGSGQAITATGSGNRILGVAKTAAGASGELFSMHFDRSGQVS